MTQTDLADRLPRRERGLVNLSLLGMAALGALFVIGSLLALSAASSSAQGNQNAADAAALAGAEAFEQAGLVLFAPGFKDAAEVRTVARHGGACPGVVRQAAAEYAVKNGAALTHCRMDRWGRVTVQTQDEVRVDGAGPARAKAQADWSLDWRGCFIDPSFIPAVPTTPEPDPAGSTATPTVEPTPVPLPPQDTWMECDGRRYTLKYAGERFFFHPWGQVKQEIDNKVTLVD